MSQSAEAAEQIVNAATNMTVKGVECVSNLAGKGALKLATFLIAVIKEEKKTKGKARMRVFNGKPTKVFVIKAKDMKTFAEEAKKYGILYAAVINKKQKDGLVDVVVNAADAAKVNRIAERFALSTVDVEKIREEIQKSREEREQKREQEQKDKDLEPKETDKQDAKSDSEDNPIKEFKYPEPKEPEQPNPTKEGTSQSPSHSAVTFGLLNSERKIKSDRPSVREQIRKMREERKQAAAEKQTPTREKAQSKRGTKPKTKTKSTKGR